MLVSYKWLKQYVDLPDSLTPEEVALKLTMSTVEVEKVKKQGDNLENIIVGEVKKLTKHPDANKLQIVVVSDGRDEYQVVCGGSNLREGMKVAFAKIGAKVRWHGEGGLVALEKTKIRGVESFGMICASTEIGLGEMFPLKDEKEILDLTGVIASGAKQSHTKLEIASSADANRLPRNDIVGHPLAKVLGLNDAVFDIDNKSMTHRPDLWGHYGLAREVAALYNKKISDLDGSALGGKDFKKMRGKNKVDLKIKIEDKENCTRYIGAVVGGIKIEPSPVWMQNHLRACGVRPINNVVDITNYVTLELGRPSHAFDRREIAEDTIIVRRAEAGEKLTTLDGQNRTLTDQMCLVCDAKRAVDLGGIMGGENSEVKADTKEIILELANFNPANIRRTSNALGLRTEAGMRFEKGLSPYLAELGLKRILTLIKQLIPSAQLLSKIVDVDYTPKENREIELDLNFVNKKIGLEIPKKEIIKILGTLGFIIKEKKKQLSVVVPEWRSVKDISIPEDLVEEVARLYGYGNIPTTLPSFPVIPPERNELRLLERKIKNILALEHGFVEVYNYSFVAPELIKKIGRDLEDQIELANPIAKDRPYIRRNLWPSLLENMENNLHRFASIKLFEIGKVFDKDKSGLRATQNSDELLPRQDLMLSAVYTEKGVSVPFYELSATLTGLLERLGYKYKLIPPEKSETEDLVAHHGRAATVEVGGQMLGAIAELHPLSQQKLGLETRAAVLEINLDKLLASKKEETVYKRLSEYPAIIRDIAFVVDKRIEHAKIVSVLRKVNPLITVVELFDVYQGKNLGDSKKSVAYHITYQSSEKTLTSEEVDKVHARVVKMLEKEFDAVIR